MVCEVIDTCPPIDKKPYIGGHVCHIVMKPVYGIEEHSSSTGSSQFYLVKHVKVKGKKFKIRKYVGALRPNNSEIKDLSSKHAFEIESKAARKKAEYSAGVFEYDYLSKEQVMKLETVRHLYHSVWKLLSVSEIEAYEQDFEIAYVHGTTTIEGNTLSLNEASKLWNYGILPKNKNLREVHEVENFKKVLKLRNTYKGRVSIDFIKKLHALILDNIDYEMAGVFRRTDNIGIQGCDVILTPSALIEEELECEINDHYAALMADKHPFERIILFHYRFERIHPFNDGNGRVGREILNYMLTKAGYPRMLFLGKDRDSYIGSFDSGDANDFPEMISTYVDLIIGQREKILKKNLKELTK